MFLLFRVAREHLISQITFTNRATVAHGREADDSNAIGRVAAIHGHCYILRERAEDC